jgi:hypothetical protein
MRRILKFIMSIFYVNENAAKYRMVGGNYLMALIGTTFYVAISCMLLTAILFSIFPETYLLFKSISIKLDSRLFGLLVFLIIFFLLRVLVKEDELQGYNYKKESLSRIINYLIAYAILAMLIIGILVLKFLR